MKFTTTRLDPELESEYRRYYLAQDTVQLFLGVILWLISFLGFAYSDFLLFGLNGRFFSLLAIRVGYTALCTVMLFVLRRPGLEVKTFDRLALLWALLTVLLDLGVGLLRPRSDLSVMINDLVGVFSLYVFISSRMSIRVIPALLLSLADLLLALFYKVGISGQIMLALAFSFNITNLVGIVFSRNYFDMRRTEFLARHEETRTRAELLRLATTDPLTGVYNRRHLLEKAEDAFYRYRRYGRPFSILLMDLDGFKSVNDTFGHQQGDVVLIDFVKMVIAEKREVDVLGRMGGDEFCVVLPETTPASAAALAERVVSRSHELTLRDALHEVQVTVSIGISQAGTADTTLDPIFARADGALYRAKNYGRNRFIIR